MEAEVLAAAQAGDPVAFESLVAGHRRELHAHCYRMLGSLEDAEDAVQETLLAAWRGIGGFEQRSSLRAWLYRIATNASLRLAERRRPRLLSWDFGPSRSAEDDFGPPDLEPVWLDPWPDDPQDAYERRESVELAYVAALQHLPPNQRAVLILRDVLAFSAAEVADLLGTSPASANSALQRARATLASRLPARTQREELAQLGRARSAGGAGDHAAGAGAERALVTAFADAWERSDVPALVALLAEDVRFTMPPLRAWFDGRASVADLLVRRMSATPWRLVPIRLNAQPAFACYQSDGHHFRLGAVNVLSLTDGKISWIAAFLDPETHARLGLTEKLPQDR